MPIVILSCLNHDILEDWWDGTRAKNQSGPWCHFDIPIKYAMENEDV
jgi:hypothetical protein